MLNVQKYLMNNSLEDLENEFGIVIKRYDDRVVLNYSQISSPKFNPICDECRALILSCPDFYILSRSFDRFYNLGEGGNFSENEFSLNDSICFTKIDGSLINMFNDGKNWHVSTRKMAFAEGETNKGNSFRKLVESVTGNLNEFFKDSREEVKNYTIICEIVSPETRIVVPYKETKLYVLAIRNKFTGEYLSQEEVENFAYTKKVKGYNIDIPDYYSFNSFDDIMESAKSLEPMEENGEGYVCYDIKTQNRIKIKNPSYLALANLRENGAISNKRIAILVFNQDYEEYLSYFPEDEEYFNPYIQAYEKMIKDIWETYNEYKDIESQKEFALNVKDLPIASFLFELRKGLGLEECFSKLSDKKKQALLEHYKIEL